jgi:hypothetical protein
MTGSIQFKVQSFMFKVELALRNIELWTLDFEL